jgi:hypothetical protein
MINISYQAFKFCSYFLHEKFNITKSNALLWQSKINIFFMIENKNSQYFSENMILMKFSCLIFYRVIQL